MKRRRSEVEEETKKGKSTLAGSARDHEHSSTAQIMVVIIIIQRIMNLGLGGEKGQFNYRKKENQLQQTYTEFGGTGRTPGLNHGWLQGCAELANAGQMYSQDVLSGLLGCSIDMNRACVSPWRDLEPLCCVSRFRPLTVRCSSP